MGAIEPQVGALAVGKRAHRISARRTILHSLAFLLPGAIATLAVTWGIAFFSPFHPHAGQKNETGYHAYFDPDDDWAYVWVAVTGKTFGTAVHRPDVQYDRLTSPRSESPPPWTYRTGSGYGYDPVEKGVIDYAFGVPFRSFGYRVVGTWTSDPPYRFIGGWPTGQPLTAIPFRPIWPGLALNTIAYSTALRLIFAVGTRALRRGEPTAG